jgi:signal peptidase I
MGKFIRDIIITIIAALAIFLILQVTIGSFKVYGTSMLPSIQHGEYIMVNKATYFFHEPYRGDIIVFHSPRSPGSDLIKRIIGLPGDTVEVKNDKVFVNGTPVVEPYILEQPKYQYPLQEVPENYYFVLGDNRNNSADSHTGWFLPQENIIGKAWVSYWPPPDWSIIEHYPILNHK